MNSGTQAGTEFSFSVAGKRVLQQQASTVQDAWNGVRRQVDMLCQEGQFGQNIDPVKIRIDLVNTAPAK